jgi:hypothetical protein
MKKLEKLSKEDLISELMMNTIKGGCCGGGTIQFTYEVGSPFQDVLSDIGGGGGDEPLPTGD